MYKLIRKINIAKENKGMTLVEVLIAIMLIGIIATTFLNMFMHSIYVSVVAQDVTNYTYAAQSVLEETRAYNYRELQTMSSARQGIDIDGDSTYDCYSEMLYEPYGIEMKQSASDTTDTLDAVYLHIIYYGEDMMVVAPDGESLYYEDMTSVTYYTLIVDNSSTVCSFQIGSDENNKLVFNRKDKTSKVIVIMNLDLKDANFTDNFYAYNQYYSSSNYVYIKLLGNETIAGTATEDGTVLFKTVNPHERCFGVLNLSTSLVKVTVNVYETLNSDVSQITMCEILEVANGESD